MKLDELSFAIIRQLRDGRKTSKAIAEEIGVSHNTVRRRIESLRQSGILEVSGLVDTGKLPNHLLAIVGINFLTRNLTEKAREVSQLDGVIAAGVVTGRYDIIALVLLNNDNDLLKFHTTQMSRIEDISFSETFVMYMNVGWKVPYVL